MPRPLDIFKAYILIVLFPKSKIVNTKKKRTKRYLERRLTVWHLRNSNAFDSFLSWEYRCCLSMSVGICSLEKSHKNLGTQLCRESSSRLPSSLQEKFTLLSPQWQMRRNRRHKKGGAHSNESNSCYFEFFEKDCSYLKLLWIWTKLYI